MNKEVIKKDMYQKRKIRAEKVQNENKEVDSKSNINW